MKTFAYTNAVGDIVGIGMIYLENGQLTPEVASFVAQHGEDAGLVAYGEKCKQDQTVTTIVIETTEMPGGTVFGYDKTFRNAFKRGLGRGVDVDIPRAKDIAHNKRRAARAAEFAPHDEVIRLGIPGQDGAAAEAARAQIRIKFAVIQAEIDACSTAEELKSIIVRL